MRKIFSLVAAVAAMSIVFSCEREQLFEESGSRTMGVNVTEATSQDVATKASDGQSEPYIFDVNGEELYLTESVSAMQTETRPVETKGAPITEVGDYFNAFNLYMYRANGDEYSYSYLTGQSFAGGAVKVTYDDVTDPSHPDWTMDETVYWPDNSDEELLFYASNSESCGPSQFIENSFSKDGVTHITYSDEGSDSGEAAMNEKDLLYAYTRTALSNTSKVTRNNKKDDSEIGLQFHHALAGIKFKFGTITNNLTLTNVTLSGIATSGECDFTEDGKSGIFAWTTGTDTTALSQSFDATATTGVTDCDAEGERTFFIIPQAITEDATVTFTFEYDLGKFSADSIKHDQYPSTDKKTFTKKLKISDIAADQYTSWEAGSLYTYTISGNLVFAELGYTIPTICSSKLSPAIKTSSVTSVKFQVSQTEIPEGCKEVQSSRSLTKVYAKFDSTTGALTLYTTAPKIFGKPDCSYLFNNLIYLTNIEGLANFNTANVTNMKGMFAVCSSLTSLDVSSFNTSNVQDFSSMFDRCSKLESVNISSFDTSSGTSFYSMFTDCSSLMSITMGDAFSLVSATNTSDMFFKCSNLTDLDVSHFKENKISNMSRMFFWCKSLETLDLSEFDTSSCTNMWAMFDYCYSLTSLNVSNFDTSNVTNMSNMFYQCSGLTSLDVSNFDTSKVEDMDNMFACCRNLVTLDVSKFDTSNVSDMSYMFYSCSSLTPLDVSKFNTSNVTTMNSMFTSCRSLTSLDVSKFDTSKVTDMGEMFNSCSSLTSLDVSKFNTSNVTKMRNMFASCSSLDSLDVSKFDTSNVKYMNCMFWNCASLTSLDLTSFDTSKVTTMENLFRTSDNMKSLTLGAKFSIADKNTTYMFYQFARNSTSDDKATIKCSADLATAITNDASNNLDTDKVEFVAI